MWWKNDLTVAPALTEEMLEKAFQFYRESMDNWQPSVEIVHPDEYKIREASGWFTGKYDWEKYKQLHLKRRLKLKWRGIWP